ncbi:MAG TPA: hypothetical protein DCF67_04425 [Brevundimonas sp.]|nr:hypothetical protein [Brevundimonas sp.]
MSFLHLYKFFENVAADIGSRQFLVAVDDVRGEILRRDYAVAVDVFPVELDESVSLGHVIIHDTKEERYEDEGGLSASIRFSRKRNTCWARFVCCKEMMHIFDGADEITDTKEKFFKLLREIEAKPIDRSAALSSEYKAEWMALLLLCPKPNRDHYLELWSDDQIGRYDIAWHFRIPEDFVAALMSEHYDHAYDRLISDLEELPAADPNEPLV